MKKISYFDEELINNLKSHKIFFEILSETEHVSIVRKINETIPFSVSKVAWSALKNSISFDHEQPELAILKLAEEIKKFSDGNLIFIGDSACDEAYAINSKQLEKVLGFFPNSPNTLTLCRSH